MTELGLACVLSRQETRTRKRERSKTGKEARDLLKMNRELDRLKIDRILVGVREG